MTPLGAKRIEHAQAANIPLDHFGVRCLIEDPLCVAWNRESFFGFHQTFCQVYVCFRCPGTGLTGLTGLGFSPSAFGPGAIISLLVFH